MTREGAAAKPKTRAKVKVEGAPRARAAAAPETVTAPARVAEFRQVQTRRTFEEVTTQVRSLLFDGSLKPGDRMPPERELCLMLGIGRPALREALRSLEAGGLIELRKGKTGGAFIATGNHRVVSGGMSDMLRLGSVTLEQMFEAREWILSALVRPACRRITAEEIARLRQNIADAEALHSQGRFSERIDRNFEFHALLAEASRNPVAVVVVRGLMEALRSLISEIGSELPPKYFDSRHALLKALEQGDEENAAKLMSQTVRASEETYKRLERARLKAKASASGGSAVAVKKAASRKAS